MKITPIIVLIIIIHNSVALKMVRKIQVGSVRKGETGKCKKIHKLINNNNIRKQARLKVFEYVSFCSI